MSPTILVKKYSNRRLYDTEASAYITQEELAEKIRKGAEVRVVDATSHEDLTQATLAQLILESRGAARLLPVPLLMQLIRMGDDALAEFFGRYMSLAMELYVSAKNGAQTLAPYAPFATLPFAATNALARMLSGVPEWLGYGQQPPPAPPAPPPPAGAMVIQAPPSPPPAAPAADDDKAALAQMRRELEELKQALKRPARAKR